MHEEIKKIILKTLNHSKNDFNNETEFKHELFHQLSTIKINNTELVEPEPKALTPRLHSEAKPQNGLPSKADILICDPYRYQSFNYEVDHVIELKQKLNARELKLELNKLDKYAKHFKSYWIVSMKKPTIDSNTLPGSHPSADSLNIICPDADLDNEKEVSKSIDEADIIDTYKVVKECIEKLLTIYGKGKQQYQSYFWCNYEHEQERKHSFPCEGDFNAHLYHLLRLRLPKGTKIYSEYKPKSLNRRRIDFLICNESNTWAIPIELKMNWDQFKPKYKDRKLVRSEALTILDRFKAVSEEFKNTLPIMVVIQGEWRISTRKSKENAQKELGGTKFPLPSFSYNEVLNKVEDIVYGNLIDLNKMLKC